MNTTISQQDILDQYNYILGCAKQHLGSDLHTAQDIAQEVVMKALTNPISEGDLRNWLYGITLYTVRSHITYKNADRRGGGMDTFRIDQVVEDQLEVEQGLLHDSAEHVALFHDLSPELLEALETLDSGLRETFWLSVVEGLKYEEIAEVLGVPVSTVGTRINKARKHLKDYLS